MTVGEEMHKIEKRRAAAILALVATVALTIVAGALADRGEPQAKITPADQARAVAMLPRRADFRQWDGATVRPTPPASPVYCKSNDQSDLTLSGKARSKTFGPIGAPYHDVHGFSRVYASSAQLKAAWQRATSSMTVACVAAAVRRSAGKAGIRFISYHKVPFPAVAQETAAYRLRYADVNGPAHVDFVLLGDSRAAVQLVFDDPLNVGNPDVRDAEVDLARIIAPRMARVKGGG